MAATFYSAVKDLLINITTGVSFVDDKSLGTTSDHQYDSHLTQEKNKKAEVSHILLSLLTWHKIEGICFILHVGL
jgi:hypothetical protein